MSASNYSTNSSQLQINKIVSNSIQNQNTITTNNLVCNNLLSTQQMTPAYMLDGTKQIGFNWHPIYGSQNQINSCRLYYLNDSNEITNDLIS